MITEKPSVSHKALPALFVGATAIGFAPILVRLSELGPTATAMYRLVFSVPVMGLWLWFSGRRRDSRLYVPDRRARSWLVAAGLFFAADLAVWHWSIKITTVANATLLGNLAPVFVVLAG